jgi:hypothetical protein
MLASRTWQLTTLLNLTAAAANHCILGCVLHTTAQHQWVIDLNKLVGYRTLRSKQQMAFLQTVLLLPPATPAGDRADLSSIQYAPLYQPVAMLSV